MAVAAEQRLRHKQGRRAMILRVARDVFLRKGYLSATMDEIAEAAGLSVGTLYLYFRNKPTLYMSLLDVALAKQEKALRSASSGGRSAAQRIQRLAEAYVDFFLREPEYFQALIFLQHGDLRIPQSEELSQRLAERGRAVLNLLVRQVREGAARGELRRVDATDCALLLYGMWNGVIGLTLRRDAMHLERRRLKALVRFALKVLQNGLRTGIPAKSSSRALRIVPAV
jgi:TetR/AcrR family transcriptional regulator